MKTKTYFAFRIDIWDDTGDSIVERVPGVDDFEMAEATYTGQPWRAGQGRGSHCGTASGSCMIPGNAPALLTLSSRRNPSQSALSVAAGA